MTHGASLHPLTAGDIPEIAPLARRIWREHYPGIIGADQIDYMLRGRYDAADLSPYLDAPDRWFDVLRQDGAACGFLRCKAVAAAGSLKIEELYVAAELRGRGFGQQLLRQAEMRARAAGCAQLMLYVNKRNELAIRAYQRFGFAISDSLVIDIGAGYVMDDYLMTMALPRPQARERTLFFIGVTTGKSSIMQVFPAWSQALGLNAVIAGIDLPPDAAPAQYRDVVAAVKRDPLALGALVTTHKLTLFKASRDLFDAIDDDAEALGEVSCISKRDGVLWGHAKDPLSSGLAFEAAATDARWREGAGMLLLGAGGAALALTLYLHNKQRAGGSVPARIAISDRSATRLEDMRGIHRTLGVTIPVTYQLAADASDNDRLLSQCAPGSLVVNATGLGKDAPGSPLSDEAIFPDNGAVWEFNYRGNLVFLEQARAQQATRRLAISDGWLYFIHGWTRAIAEVFQLDIPTSGPRFEQLCALAATAQAGTP